MMRYATLGFCLATLVLAGCADDAPTAIANEGNLPQYAAFAGAGFPEIIPLPTGFQPEGIAVGRGTLQLDARVARRVTDDGLDFLFALGAAWRHRGRK